MTDPKVINFTYEEKEEAESLLLEREKVFNHPNGAGIRFAYAEARVAVWKEKMTEAQALNLWDAIQWSRERILGPFTSRSKMFTIRAIENKLLDRFQAP